MILQTITLCIVISSSTFSATIDNDRSDDRNLLRKNLNDILEEYDLGFKRPERLDVKKPGPPFDDKMVKDKLDQRFKEVLLPSMMKKEPRGAHPNPSHEVYDVDTDYVYVAIRNKIKTWKQGDEIIKNISSLLSLEQGVLSHGRVDRNEVTFRVNPNKVGLNASDLATKIWDIRDELKDATGVDIVATGVGDKI